MLHRSLGPSGPLRSLVPLTAVAASPRRRQRHAKLRRFAQVNCIWSDRLRLARPVKAGMPIRDWLVRVTHLLPANYLAEISAKAYKAAMGYLRKITLDDFFVK